MTWRHVTFFCPSYDGTPPPGHEIPSIEEQTAAAQAAVDRGRPWDFRPPEPLHCTFRDLDRPDAPPRNGEGSYMFWDGDTTRADFERRLRCTRHNVAPQVFAQRAAFDRRHSPIRDTRWRQERVAVVRTGHRLDAWGGGGRTYWMWRPNRPRPVTLRTAWQAEIAR